MTARNRLSLLLYAPALVGNDSRPLAVVHGLERALPGLHLEWKVSQEGELIALPQRETWLAEAVARGKFPLLCNGDESYPVTVSGAAIPASLAAGGQPMLDVHADLTLDATMEASAVVVLAEAAEAARAFWGRATPFEAAVEISRQTRDPVHKPGVPPRGLPALKFPEKMLSPAIPQYLGWLNYWSPEAARAIGFPDPSRDADLLSRSQRTSTGGWVVQLTEAPLDLDNPAHLETLMRAYERFPEIGGREAPR